MTKEKFNQMLVRIYAAFGRTAPAENSAISVLLYERVRFIGEEYCDKIAETLEEYEKLPANVGWVIISVYNSLAPVKEHVKQKCERCYNDTGFYWFVNEKYSAPGGYSLRCPFCNGGSVNDLNAQLARGSKPVPNNKIASDFWEECFGEWVPPAERAKQQNRQAPDTPNAGTTVAEHFKPISQVVDHFNGLPDDFWAEA